MTKDKVVYREDKGFVIVDNRREEAARQYGRFGELRGSLRAPSAGEYVRVE